MSRSRGRLIAALLAALALAFAATALAVKPKPGAYSNGDDKRNINFVYDDGDIIQFVSSSVDCHDGQPAIVKEIKVKRSGKFDYDGKATGQLAGDRFHVEVKGEFVSKKKAKGSFHRDGCDKEDFTAKFVGNAG